MERGPVPRRANEDRSVADIMAPLLPIYSTRMTCATSALPDCKRLLDQQHLVMYDVSWAFYQRVLDHIGNGSLRVTFDCGSMEITRSLLEHERAKGAFIRLLEMMTLELDVESINLGSTTFCREDAQFGIDPDVCFYLMNADRIRRMKRFDPAKYPPPDLVIDMDIVRRAIPRLPVYAALDVPELWRFDGAKLTVLVLQSGTYRQAGRSPTFRLLPMDLFSEFIRRALHEEQTSVVRAFRDWLRSSGNSARHAQSLH